MKKLTALTLGSMIILNSASFAFSDLTEEHWAYRNVMNMQEKGIISGFEDNTFRPSDSLTREQFITMVVKGLNIENAVSSIQFEDSEDRWSTEFIKVAGDMLVDVGDTEFRPTENALREDVAMAIVRLNNLEDAEYSLDTLNNFSDRESISQNRQKYVAIAVENGFMSGNSDGTFSPVKALSRAEGATVIFNMLNREESVIEENVINWDGEYISNIDGLTKVKLTKISDTEVNFYIRGMKDSTFAINNNAIITGDIAKYEHDMFDEKTEFNFRFEGPNLIIETLGDEELAIFDGIYKVDDGSVSTIERTIEKNPLEGSYLLGEEVETPEFESFEELEAFLEDAPNSMEIEINNIASDTADFSIGGFIDGNILAMMGNLEKNGDKWRYFDEYDEKYTIELEFVDNAIVVTGLTEDKANISGTYIKQAENLDNEYEEYAAYVDEIEMSEGGLMY